MREWRKAGVPGSGRRRQNGHNLSVYSKIMKYYAAREIYV